VKPRDFQTKARFGKVSALCHKVLQFDFCDNRDGIFIPAEIGTESLNVFPVNFHLQRVKWRN